MSKNIEILIVEEDLIQAEHLKHILEQHDHPVSVVHNGQLALAHIRQHKPQIVISAVHLPEMNGYELCREIKADEELKDIPVILLTSLSDATDIIRGMECGADNFITKPYDEKLLLSRIEYIVLNRELRVGAGTQTGLEIIFGGEKYSITPERQQMVDLLISTYETAVQKNVELIRVQEELNALNERLEEKVGERTAALVGEITRHRTAEVALKDSENRYRQLVELFPEMIAIHSEGCFAYVNAAGIKLLGAADSEELIGKPILDIVHPDYREAALLRMQQNLEGEQTPLIEQKILRLDGQVIDVETSGIPTTYQDKAAVTVIIRDITERKQAEERLRRSEEWLRSVFNASRDGILVEDDGVIVYVNKSQTQMLGYDAPEELLGRHISELLPPEDAERMVGYTKARLRGETPPTVYEFKAKQKDGSLIDTEAAVSTTTIAGKKYVITAARDITDRRQAEQSLIDSEERLQQSQKMEAIGTLAGGVAHDFNNLLTAILGNTQLARRKLAPDDPLQNRLIEVEKAGNRAAVLTRQLLAFSRRQHLERRTINLNDTISEIMKLLQRIIGADVEMRMKYAPDVSAIFADPSQIEQVVMNLGVNARDAMPEGGLFTIETSNVELDESYCRKYPYVQPGRYVQISVSDTGTGMDEETQARIFEPFFTTKEIGKGTGLGLSMVYGIIKQHDGHINMYSEVGHGTVFKIYLPVDEKAVEQEAQAIEFPLHGGTETILVAEDEESLRNLAGDILEGLGYTVLLATNGEEAVEMYAANRERIDMLLLDVVMPRMGGLEAYEQIRELGGDVPLLCMTGYSSETVQSRFVKRERSAEDLGAMVIQKPYSVIGLGRKVRELLDGARRK